MQSPKNKILADIYPMSRLKFEEKLSLINKNDLQFQNFIHQVKPKNSFVINPRLNITERDLQNESGYQNPTIKEQNRQIEPNPQTDPLTKYQSTLAFSKLFTPKDRYESAQLVNHRSAIKDLNRLNPYPNKSLQQDKIKRQSSPIIQIKSVKELPPWLFEHLRVQNTHLKNRKYRLGQNNSYYELRNQKNSYLHRKSNFSTQRYLNLPPQSCQTSNFKNSPQHFKDRYYNQSPRKEPFSQSKIIHKSSSQNCTKQIFYKKHPINNNKYKDFIINDYQYPYITNIQEDKTFSNINLNQSALNIQKSFHLRKIHPSKTTKPIDSKFIENKNKSLQKPFMTKMLKKRLDTVSEQMPLTRSQ